MEELLKFEVEQPENEGPVTCLGITFPNDNERREFFRNELRKKLPELKLLDGFPIGEDEDIIALSDPPYYTACPNPWLNDFIKSWEDDKTQLTKDGKRTDNFEVKEPYASDVSEGKNNPIYNAHSYHTKVPHPAIMRYILHYTQPGDIIFDGFSGTGMTGVAATMCGHPETDIKLKIESEAKSTVLWGKRRCILSDLSPVASLIAANYNTPMTNASIFDSIERKLDQVESELGWIYKTKDNNGRIFDINYVVWSDVFICPNCGGKINFYEVAVEPDTGLVRDNFSCPKCGAVLTKKKCEKALSTTYDPILETTISQQEKVPVLINYSTGKRNSYNKKLSQEDLDIIQEALELSHSCKFVKNRMMEGSEARRNDRQGLTHVHHFYFPRTLLILERLLSLCSSKESKFLIDSQLINVSKLNRYRPGVSFPYNPLSGTLYIGSQISEANVFVALRNKLIKLKKAIPSIHGENLVGVSSATKLNIRSNSIDYMFIDPPFGANISYSELNYIQEAWLKVFTNNMTEAIVNHSHHKGLFEYQNLMTLCLHEFYRILKPGKWLTMEFSNTSASVWNSIQNALQGVGFIVVNVAALDKKQGSFKAVTSPTAVKQDLIITCYKPADELISKFSTQDIPERNVWDFVDDLLNHLPIHLKKDNSTTTVVERSAKILFDRLVAYYVQHGYAIPMNASEFQSGLKRNFVERDGMYFTAEQAIEYEEKKKQTNSFVRLALFIGSEAEGIEWLKNKLEKGPKTYSELSSDWMQDLVTPKKGDVLPELMQILDENFLKDENGYWHIPDINDQSQKEAMRTKRLLKEFDVYIEAKKIKTARLEALRCGFKECYKNKDFATIINVGNKLPEQLLMEDEILLQYYDIASTRV